MNLDRAVRLQGEMVSRINDTIGSAVSFKSSAITLREAMNKRVGEPCQKAPRWLQCYLRGYEDAAREQMIRQHIVSGKWHDGVFYCTYRNHKDYAETQVGFVDWKTYGEWPGDGGMYWRDNPVREFFVYRPEEDEEAIRRHARENYKLGEPLSESRHPAWNEEARLMNLRAVETRFIP